MPTTILSPMSPILGPLVEGDLCNIRTHGGRRYCGQDAVREAIDCDGRSRLLCESHTAMLFPYATTEI